MADKDFHKYQHLERFGTDEVLNIELGEAFVFPKIDGTNGSTWIEEGILMAGSRNRVLSMDNDNAGFYAHVSSNEAIRNFLNEFPDRRLYGEWLVPHSLKTYRDDSWRKFYVFDVAIIENGSPKYLPYHVYKSDLDKHSIEYLAPIAIVKNGKYETFCGLLEKNNYLIKDGHGVGEGIVIKNYAFFNKYGRQTWAKMVRSEFKELAHKEFGAPLVQGGKMIEEEVIKKYCTNALIEKVYEKIRVENDGFQSKHIPQLLNTVYYDMIREDSWDIIKTFKNPTINFSTLKHLSICKIKETKPEIFA